MRAKQLQRRAIFVRFRGFARGQPLAASPITLAALAIALVASVAHGANCSWQSMSGNWSSATNWSGTVVPSGFDTAYVANGGTAVITVPGASFYYLYVGDSNSSASGAIQMRSGNLTPSYCEYIGNKGPGTFSQSGGTNNVGAGLYLAYYSGVSSSYSLSGSGLLSAGGEYVGDNGTGTITQTGGTNNVSGTLFLSFNSGAVGTYNLSGPAVLSAPQEDLGGGGVGGAATFNQSGGTNTTSYLWLASGSSTYTLSGSGVLISAYECVNSASATFTQLGGLNLATNLVNYGRYRYGGGTLEIGSGGFANRGLAVFDGMGSSGTLTVAGSSIVNFSSGTIQNVGAMSMTVGPGSLVLVSTAFNPANAFHYYSNLGLTHTIGTTLTISPGQSFAGCGSIEDLLDCQGTVSSLANQGIDLEGGVAITGTGSVNDGSGTVVVSNSRSSIIAGSLYAGEEDVVSGGSFAQSGGTNTTGLLTLGNMFPRGNYVLTGGIVVASEEQVDNGDAFLQSGGTNSLISGKVYGGELDIVGSYTLNGPGLLTANSELVNGGTFAQSGGTNNANGVWNTIDVGYNLSGTYSLTGSGLVLGFNELIGNSAAGTFIQSGGTNDLTSGGGSLNIGYYSGTVGTYNLSGSGILSACIESIGSSGTGTFNQSGGTNTATNAFLLGTAGTYNLTGGALIVPGIQGTGVFNLGGGTLVVRSVFSTSQAIVLSGSGGNGNIDAGGYSVVLAGALSGSGGLNIIGDGTVTVTASDTYTGPTTINGGKLIVDGSLVSLVTVNGGGTLGGTGNLASITVNSGGHLAPGNAPGTLTLAGSLTLLSGAKMDYELDTPLDSDMVLMTSGASQSQRPAILGFQHHAARRLWTWRVHAHRRRLDQRQPGRERQRQYRRIASEPSRAGQ